MCQEAVLKLEAICGGGKQETAMEEPVSDRRSSSVNASNRNGPEKSVPHDSPDYHRRNLENLSPLQTTAYQIPLVDRSLNQSMSYPPPPPPSPGHAIKVSPLASGEVESKFVLDSPSPPPTNSPVSSKYPETAGHAELAKSATSLENAAADMMSMQPEAVLQPSTQYPGVQLQQPVAASSQPIIITQQVIAISLYACSLA